MLKVPRHPLYVPEVPTNEVLPQPEILYEQVSKMTEMATGQPFALSPDLFQKMIYSPNATLLQEVGNFFVLLMEYKYFLGNGVECGIFKGLDDFLIIGVCVN